MIPPPGQTNPFVGVDNPALPPTTGGVFVAWGWFRDLFNVAIPSAVADFNAYANPNTELV